MVLHLFRDEVVLGDLELLFLGITGNLQYFHPVSKGRWNRIEHVRGRDEQHFRQIERHVEVVVAEGAVLFRVEHLEQRR